MFLIYLAVIVNLIVFSEASKCHMNSVGGSVCTLNPKDFNPSQVGIADVEVTCKVNYLESMSKSEVTKYLSSPKRMVEIIIGPDGYYLLDGHHLSKAVNDADIKDDLKEIYCLVRDNWSGFTMDEFWYNMIFNNYAWLYDEKGYAPISPEIFPQKLDDMLNDPYRTLAWLVCDAGGFAKNGTPFEDFLWANYFRTNLPLTSFSEIKQAYKEHSKFGNMVHGVQQFFTWCEVNPYSPECLPDQVGTLQKLLPLALELAASPSSKSMPGFGSGTVAPPKCGPNVTNEILQDYFMKKGIPIVFHEEDDDEI